MTTALAGKIILRPMCEADLEAVMAVELAAYPFPWKLGNFRDCLKNNYPCLVCEQQGEIVAYVVLMLVLDEMHILNLCVNPEFQGQRLGTELLQQVEKFGNSREIETCFLEVRPSNKAAVKLYTHHGFNEIGLRKGYYPAKEGREDALVMAKTLFFRDFQ